MFKKIQLFTEKLLHECKDIQNNPVFNDFVFAIRTAAEAKIFNRPPKADAPPALSIEVITLPPEPTFPKALSDLIASKPSFKSPADAFTFALSVESKLQLDNHLLTFKGLVLSHLESRKYKLLEELLSSLKTLFQHFQTNALAEVITYGTDQATKAWNNTVTAVQSFVQASLKDGSVLDIQTVKERLADVFFFDATLRPYFAPDTSDIDAFLHFFNTSCCELILAKDQEFSCHILLSRMGKLSQLAAKPRELILQSFEAKCDLKKIYQDAEHALEERLISIKNHAMISIEKERFIEACPTIDVITQSDNCGLHEYLNVARADLKAWLVQITKAMAEGIKALYEFNLGETERNGLPTTAQLQIWRQKWKCLSDCADSDEIKHYVDVPIKKKYYEPLKTGLYSFIDRMAEKTTLGKPVDAKNLVTTVQRLNLLLEFDPSMKDKLLAAKSTIMSQLEDHIFQKATKFRELLKKFPTTVSRGLLIKSMNRKLSRVQDFQELEDHMSEHCCHLAYRQMIKKLRDLIDDTAQEFRIAQKEADDPKHVESIAQRLYDLFQVEKPWDSIHASAAELPDFDKRTISEYKKLTDEKEKYQDQTKNPLGITPWKLTITTPRKDVEVLAKEEQWQEIAQHKTVLTIFLKNGFACEYCRNALKEVNSCVEVAATHLKKEIQGLLPRGEQKTNIAWFEISEALGKLKQMSKAELGKTFFDEALRLTNDGCREFLRNLDLLISQSQFSEFKVALQSLKDSIYVIGYLNSQSMTGSREQSDYEKKRDILIKEFETKQKEFLSPDNFQDLLTAESWELLAEVLSSIKLTSKDTYTRNVNAIKAALRTKLLKVKNGLNSLLDGDAVLTLESNVSNLGRAQKFLGDHLQDTFLENGLGEVQKAIFEQIKRQARTIYTLMQTKRFKQANQTLCSLLYSSVQFQEMCGEWRAVTDLSDSKMAASQIQTSLDLVPVRKYSELEIKKNPDVTSLGVGEFISALADTILNVFETLGDILVAEQNATDAIRILEGIKEAKEQPEADTTVGVEFETVWANCNLKLESFFTSQIAELSKPGSTVDGLQKGLAALNAKLSPLEGVLERFDSTKLQLDGLTAQTHKKVKDTVQNLSANATTKAGYQALANALRSNALPEDEAQMFVEKVVRENTSNVEKLQDLIKSSNYNDLPPVLEYLATLQSCKDLVQLVQDNREWKDPIQPVHDAKATITKNLKDLATSFQGSFTMGAPTLDQQIDQLWQIAPLSHHGIAFETQIGVIVTYILNLVSGWNSEVDVKLKEWEEALKPTASQDLARIINTWRSREPVIDHLKHKFSGSDLAPLPGVTQKELESLKTKLSVVPSWRDGAAKINKMTAKRNEDAKGLVEKEQWDFIASSLLLFNALSTAFPSDPDLDQGPKCQTELVNAVKAKRAEMKARALDLWKDGNYTRFGKEVHSMKEFDVLFKKVPFYPLESERHVEAVTEVAQNEVNKLKSEFLTLSEPEQIVQKMFILKQMAGQIPALTRPVQVAIGDILKHNAQNRGNNSVFQIGLALQAAVGGDESRWGKEIIKDHAELAAIANKELNELLNSTRKGIDEVLAPPTGEPTEKNLRSLAVFWGTELHPVTSKSWWSAIKSAFSGSQPPVDRLRSAYKLYEQVNDALLKKYVVDEGNSIADNVKALSAECINVAQGKSIPILAHTSLNTKDRIPILIAHIFALWTLISSGTFYRETKPKDISVLRVPHIVQVLSIFRILNVDKLENITTLKPEHLENHLIQIGTGEGKSVTLGVLSCVLALHGLRPYCVCYSDYLSSRDRASFSEMFARLNIDPLVHYSTFEKLCNLLVNRHADVRELTSKFVRGDASPTPGKGHSFDPATSILLIDEVDVFFSETFFGSTYNPGVDVTSPAVATLIEHLWTLREKPDELQLDKIIKLPQYIAVLKELTQCDAILSNEVDRMIHHLRHQSFMVPIYHTDKAQDKIGYPQHGTINYSMKIGYKTMWAYMHEYYINKSVSEATKDKHRAISLCCGAFAYSEIPKKFAKILGVTGTLANMSDYEKSVVADVYNIKKATFTPSVYGPNKCIFQESAGVLVKDKNSWFQTIRQQIDKPIADGRACLVFFINETVLKEFVASRYGSGFNKMNQLIETTPDQEFAIQMASVSGQVTLLSRMFGRGIDFICQDQRVKKQGVHVIQTFLSESESEEVQVRGRTARQGQEGSFELILCDEDLEREYGIKPQKTKAAFNSDSLYSFLCSERNAFVQKKAEERDKKFKRTKELHAISDELLDLLITAGPSLIKDPAQRGNGLAKLGQFQPTAAGEASVVLLHTIFVIDVSYSMSDDDAKPSKAHLKAGGAAMHDNRLGAVLEGTETYITKRKAVSPGDLVTVIGFDDDIPFYIAPQEVSKFDLKSLLQLVPSGGTSFDPPIEQVQITFDDYPPVHHTPFVFFLSDGEGTCTTGPDLVRGMKAKWPNFRLDACRFGSDVSGEPVLTQLANAGGGTLLKSGASLQQLEQIMESMDLMFD